MSNEKQIDSILLKLKFFKFNGVNLEYICFHGTGEKDNWKSGIKKENIRKFLPKYYFIEVGGPTGVKDFTLEEVVKSFIPINELLDIN